MAPRIKRSSSKPKSTKQDNLFPVTEERISITLPTKLVELIEEIACSRGVTVAKLIETSITKIKPIKKELDLRDLVGFGRYAHLTVEQVIRCDESYAEWMLNKCENKQFTSICHELFDELRGSLR